MLLLSCSGFHQLLVADTSATWMQVMLSYTHCNTTHITVSFSKFVILFIHPFIELVQVQQPTGIHLRMIIQHIVISQGALLAGVLGWTNLPRALVLGLRLGLIFHVCAWHPSVIAREARNNFIDCLITTSQFQGCCAGLETFLLYLSG